MEKKILIVVDQYRGGAGNMAQILAMALRDTGNNVSLMFWDASDYSRYNLSNIQIYDLNNVLQKEQTNKIVRLFKNCKILSKEISKINPDIIISFLDVINSTVLLSKFFSKKPIIVSERTNPKKSKRSIHWKVIRFFMYQFRANLITLQFKEFENFNGGIHKKKCIITPNIIITPTHQKSYEEERNSDVIKFISCARYASVKRFSLMVEIFQKVHDLRPNTQLHIYGTGSEDEVNRLTQAIVENKVSDCVYLHGHVPNTSTELVNADIYLMTSEIEGFPNALSEAMAVGLPSISFKCHNGLYELVKSGENGYLIDEGDIDSFVNQAVDLIDNAELRQEIGEKAKEVVINYSKESIIKIWNEAIQKVMA